MQGFDRLHPAVQHHVVNTLGWSALRPLQEEVIAPVLDGEHVLALAPTAGGKTEAAVFPLLSRIATEQSRGLRVLYVCPLRALLNNLHSRLERYAAFIGARAGLWHGDVGASARGRIFDDPPEILLTTPESVEAMLISVRRDHRSFFARLQSVVIDEVHAFGGDDRGWHLLAVLERLSAVAGRDLQRIGLSATVGDPDSLLEWLVGSSRGSKRVVAPQVDAPVAPELTLDHVGSLSNAAKVIASLHAGEKRLVFCDSRARVEELAVDLRGRGVETFVSHSSLALDERRRAEAAFSEAQNCVIVATSTLELGIDVGDLDRVIQVDSSGTVTSFLQRLGRTGRRSGATRNMLFLTTKPELQVVTAAALLLLFGAGYVEPVVPPAKPYHLLAQQVLAYALQEGAVARSRWSEVIGRLPEFAGAIEAGIGDRILDHLVASGMLFDDGHGILSIGPEGERSYGYRHFIDLTSAFTSNPLFVVRHGSKELGLLDPISLLTPDRHLATVLLAGHAWHVTSIDWDRRFAWVEPADESGRSRWQGDSRPMSAELCDAIRNVLAGSDPRGVTLTRRAEAALSEVREAFDFVQAGRTALVDGADRTTWWTFAGLHANAALMSTLDPLLAHNRPDNLSIELQPGVDSATLLAQLQQAKEPPSASSPAAGDLASKLKFADCLPDDLARSITAARTSDPKGVARAVAEPIVAVARS
jgi:ATP-dependent Lhr-like helicase